MFFIKTTVPNWGRGSCFWLPSVTLDLNFVNVAYFELYAAETLKVVNIYTDLAVWCMIK